MAVTPAIFQRYDDDILRDAVWSGTSPSTSYSLATLGLKNPAARVRFGATSATVTATVLSARGDILVIPMHNLTPGSSAVLTITNGAGLSQAIPIPALQANSYPATLVVDLSLLVPLAATRTSTVWNFVIAGNAANIILGGAILLYGGKTSFLGNAAGDNFQWAGYTERELHYASEVENEYGTRYIADRAAASRSVDVQIAANAAGLIEVRDWYRGCHGRGLPGFFWPDPTVADGYFGLWQREFSVGHVYANYHPVQVTFDELAKGQTIA